jgi:hypothetical protein
LLKSRSCMLQGDELSGAVKGIDGFDCAKIGETGLRKRTSTLSRIVCLLEKQQPGAPLILGPFCAQFGSFGAKSFCGSCACSIRMAIIPCAGKEDPPRSADACLTAQKIPVKLWSCEKVDATPTASIPRGATVSQSHRNCGPKLRQLSAMNQANAAKKRPSPSIQSADIH